MKNALTILLAAVLVALGGCSGGGPTRVAPMPPPPPDDTDPLVVVTSKGEVRGTPDGASQAFLGIPYAKPPTGERRWAAPEAPDPWSDTLQATAYAPVCPQPETPLMPAVIGDEDCLYLHLWRPAAVADDPDAALPVMVFIHGGGNYFGGATQPMDELLDGVDPDALLYEGAALAAAGNVIVITVNYRLAALGYLAHPVLSAASGTGTSGNYGIMDQQLALQWVQDEIAAFGGDPNKVMLFGQSAGATNTCVLLASPLSVGLFQRVGIHSGNCATPPRARLEDRGTSFIVEMGCANAGDIVGCLRAVPVENIVRAISAIPNLDGGLGVPAFAPTVDGRVLLESPDQAISAGRHNAMPTLMGANSAEYSQQFSDITANELPDLLAGLMPPEFLAEGIALYAPARYDDSPTAAYVAAYSDRNIVCNMRRVADALVANQTQPVFFYLFDQTLSTPARQGPGPYHTTELLFLFQHMDGEFFSATDAERTVAADMAAYWTTFADRGATVAPPGLSAWQTLVSADQNYLRIQPVPDNETRLREEQCAFWDAVRAGQ